MCECVHLQKSRPPPHLDFLLHKMTTHGPGIKYVHVVFGVCGGVRAKWTQESSE